MKVKIQPIQLISIIIILSGCVSSFEKRFDCSLGEIPPESSQHYNVLFIGANLTSENNIPRMVGKLAKSMGDSLFYLTSAPYDYDFDCHFRDYSTKAMIRDFKWDYVVMQESGWRNALPESMADTMSFRWADSLKQFIIEQNPKAQLILFLTNGFESGVNAVDRNWAQSDPDVSTYSGMQERVKQNCLTLANYLNAKIAPCGILWKICLDNDSTLNFFLNDNMTPTMYGSYLSACTLYCSLFKKKLELSYHPIEVSEEEALFFQLAVSEALFECNPDWRSYK
jgi:hypothetical protein